MRLFLVVNFVGLMACNKDEEVEYVQYNADCDTLGVRVGIDDEIDPVETSIHSSTGEVEIGWAEIRPGGGPIGTEHEIVVVVDDDYEDVIDLLTVRTDSGDRGEDEYALEQDSADEGYYKLSLESVGETGEIREDMLTFFLWQVVETEETDNEEDEEDTDDG